MSNMQAASLKRGSFNEKLKAYTTKMKARGKEGEERSEILAQYQEHKLKAKNQWKQGEEIQLQNQLTKTERQIVKIKDELAYIRSLPLHEITHTVTTVPGEQPASTAPAAPAIPSETEKNKENQGVEEKMTTDITTTTTTTNNNNNIATSNINENKEPLVGEVKHLTITTGVTATGAKIPADDEVVLGPSPPSAPPAPQPPTAERGEGRIAKLTRGEEMGSNNSLVSADQVFPIAEIPSINQQQQQQQEPTKFKIPIIHEGRQAIKT